jgi:hypothetical protein
MVRARSVPPRLTWAGAGQVLRVCLWKSHYWSTAPIHDSDARA